MDISLLVSASNTNYALQLCQSVEHHSSWNNNVWILPESKATTKFRVRGENNYTNSVYWLALTW